MNSQTLDHIRATIRDVADFPKPGILFKDITPLIGDGPALRTVVDMLAEGIKPLKQRAAEKTARLRAAWWPWRTIGRPRSRAVAAL